MQAKKGEVVETKLAPVPRKVSKKRGPKRMSGYQFFLRACLDEMKAQYPDASIVLSAVSKLCAENWQKMSDETRQRFYDEADAVNNSQIGKVKITKQKRVYKRRPLTGFKVFCKERRIELKRFHPDFTKDQVACKLANMWMTLHPKFKSSYEKLALGQFEDPDLTAAKLVEEYSSEPEEEKKDVDEKNVEGKTTDDEEILHMD